MPELRDHLGRASRRTDIGPRRRPPTPTALSASAASCRVALRQIHRDAGDRDRVAAVSPQSAEQVECEGAGVVWFARAGRRTRDPRRGFGRAEPEVRGQRAEATASGCAGRPRASRAPSKPLHHAARRKRPAPPPRRSAARYRLRNSATLSLSSFRARAARPCARPGESYLSFASFQAFQRSIGVRDRVNEAHHRRVPEVGVFVVVGLEQVEERGEEGLFAAWRDRRHRASGRSCHTQQRGCTRRSRASGSANAASISSLAVRRRGHCASTISTANFAELVCASFRPVQPRQRVNFDILQSSSHQRHDRQPRDSSGRRSQAPHRMQPGELVL